MEVRVFQIQILHFIQDFTVSLIVVYSLSLICRAKAGAGNRRYRGRYLRPASAAGAPAGDEGKFVAIDVGSGDYEIDEDDYAAVARLRSPPPAADVWLMRPATRQRIGWELSDDPRGCERPSRGRGRPAGAGSRAGSSWAWT